MVADAEVTFSNMQVAGISLEKSDAAGEGQRGLSCQSCMQQAVQHHITPTNPTSHQLKLMKNLMQSFFYTFNYKSHTVTNTLDYTCLYCYSD